MVWKQRLDQSGFGQATEREACENALDAAARRAAALLKADAAKLGL